MRIAAEDLKSADRRKTVGQQLPINWNNLRAFGKGREVIEFREVTAHGRIVAMSFQITTTRSFSAAHQLRLYDGSLEQLHGHNWRVRVTVAAQKLDSIGVVMDFHELERLLDQLIAPLHNRHLNETDEFSSLNPSAENVAAHIGRFLGLPDRVNLVSVEVWETQENSAVYRPDV